MPMRERANCTHEVIVLAQDGSEMILCGDCGWEFGHIGRGGENGKQMFHAYVEPGNAIIVVARKDEKLTDFAVGVTTTGDGIGVSHEVHPCATCRWAQSCEDGCHS